MDKYIKYEDIQECRFFQDERGEWILHADIIKIPAADVVPVVRCGECKLYGGRSWENGKTGICARTDIGVAHDDFCSYGLRKDGDGDA